ncbi:MAG: hypothetical protein KU38_10755 [Sulfurovum sp. FS08-3]|nr:MAG: hypothetical protein KU38_10755 [Sulfurovum sp. FS08-3]
MGTRERLRQHKYAGKIADEASDLLLRIGLKGFNKSEREVVEQIILEALGGAKSEANANKRTPMGGRPKLFEELKDNIRKKCKG